MTKGRYFKIWYEGENIMDVHARTAYEAVTKARKVLMIRRFGRNLAKLTAN